MVLFLIFAFRLFFFNFSLKSDFTLFIISISAGNFSKYKVNLTNIESRPSKKKAWDYFFFVDFLGNVEDAKVKKALTEIEAQCGSVNILGSYTKF